MTQTYSDFVKSRAKDFPTKLERVEHGLLGLIGELGELADAVKKNEIYGRDLDRENVLEELGDLKFYTQMIINEVEGPFLSEGSSKPKQSSRGHIFRLSQYLGYISEDLCYLKLDRVKFFSHYLDEAIRHFGFTVEEVLSHNIQKLETRYPIKYSDELASARLDKVVNP